MIKVGKATAAAIGSGILLLQIANHNGYIKINWDKVTKKAEELSEKVDERTTKPNLLKKVSIEVFSARLIALIRYYDSYASESLRSTISIYWIN